MIAIGVVWWLLSLAPLLYAALMAFRARPVLPRRFLFVALIVALSYGLLVFFLFAIIIPLAAFNIYIAPGLVAVNELPLVGGWLVEVGDAIASWGGFVVPLILAITSITLTRYLAARWQKLVTGLAPNNSFKPNPLRRSA